MAETITQHVGRGLQRLEYLFDQKGVLLNGMTVDLRLREWADEELFDLLRDVDRAYEKIKTPCEVLMASIWKRIQETTTTARRGHLMRHTFGELRGKAMMSRLTVLARIVKYWEKVGEPIAFGVPFWLYEEIATQGLPGQRAIERIAQYKRQTRNDAPLTRATIRDEGLQLKHTTVVVEDTEARNGHTPIKDSILKESLIGDSPDSVGRVLPKILPRREEPQTLWQAAPEPIPDPSKRSITFTVTLPKWAEDVLDVEAVARRVSLSRLIEQWAEELRLRHKEQADADAIPCQGA